MDRQKLIQWDWAKWSKSLPTIAMFFWVVPNRECDTKHDENVYVVSVKGEREAGRKEEGRKERDGRKEGGSAFSCSRI